MSDVAYRPTYLNVDLDAILYNYNILKHFKVISW